jgi:hypothetical protein
MQVELRTGNPAEVLVRLGRTADLLVVAPEAPGAFGLASSDRIDRWSAR